MYGRNGLVLPKHLEKRIEQIEKGDFKKALDALVTCSTEELRKIYVERDKEPED
jgi:hypothetical protein